ncbi:MULTISPECIES: hypothetical protein [Streptomyces]|uniref:Uncharacterized protein n=2 Tax=Streptomyces TaxID=1883 RepID=A0ABT9LNF4_STRGD|nr:MULTISPECIES: hypothetical protein [Streptomyces]MDP9685068.1 hypothetical protein [Streptomyces griseoviridis]GGT14999.1 hypothetical protein GCM10010240_55310 [Streptomyces griseoviridis]GGU60187.1 hypothetical protein GCM10010259_58740 [Streptomyces daghestanicus]GHI31966.1 hypothetical protein Sdagh_36960 [Streptomyces daghestanicus]GHI33416.1 hypothetical protein Sdagh_51460 [Streptomyces daghestanicus]
MSGNPTAAPAHPGGPAAPPAPGPRFTAHHAGRAWLLAPAGPVDPRARAFTAGLAPDPEATVVVADLPDGADDATLDRLARAVPAGTGDLRLVFGRPPLRDPVAVARWLAARLGRAVVVARGPLLSVPGGGLYAGPAHGPGWLRCPPGGPAVPHSRTFPRPTWEAALPDHPWRLGRSVAEPLPAGVWLRPADGVADPGGHRGRLLRGAGVHADLLTVAVGAPGAPAVPVADVARFWQDLPPSLRPAVRFLCYGPARLSGGRHFGDVLAQVVGEPVRLLGGLPRPGRDGADAALLTGPDGTPGRPLRAREFVHLPPAATEPPASPYAVAHGWPLGDLPEAGPGAHRLAEDVVVEVVRGGLWVRPEPAPAHAAQVRGADPDPEHERVLCDAGSEDLLPRLRRLAQELTRSFPADLRRAVRLGVCRPTGPDGGAVPHAAPAPGGGTAPHRAAPPPLTSGAGDAARTGLTALAAEVLRRHPELTGRETDADAVTALAAVLGRLAGAACESPGDLALLRRGLDMLPVHHGPTGLRAPLDEPMRQWYATPREITDPQPCEASARGPADAPGGTDFLIWSTNGRRTDLLDPLVPGRVLFAPGTRFRVLEADPGAPGVVLMRELAPGEPAGDTAADRAAARDLVRALRTWNTGHDTP